MSWSVDEMTRRFNTILSILTWFLKANVFKKIRIFFWNNFTQKIEVFGCPNLGSIGQNVKSVQIVEFGQQYDQPSEFETER